MKKARIEDQDERLAAVLAANKKASGGRIPKLSNEDVLVYCFKNYGRPVTRTEILNYFANTMKPSAGYRTILGQRINELEGKTLITRTWKKSEPYERRINIIKGRKGKIETVKAPQQTPAIVMNKENLPFVINECEAGMAPLTEVVAATPFIPRAEEMYKNFFVILRESAKYDFFGLVLKEYLPSWHADLVFSLFNLPRNAKERNELNPLQKATGTPMQLYLALLNVLSLSVEAGNLNPGLIPDNEKLRVKVNELTKSHPREFAEYDKAILHAENPSPEYKAAFNAMAPFIGLYGPKPT